jgi:hypothetical protein
VSLYSPQGTAVRSQKSMNREISLDISSLSPGIYILEVNYSRGRSVNKVIVE